MTVLVDVLVAVGWQLLGVTGSWEERLSWSPGRPVLQTSESPEPPHTSSHLLFPTHHIPVTSVIFPPLNWDKVTSCAGWKPLNTNLGVLGYSVALESLASSPFGNNFSSPQGKNVGFMWTLARDLHNWVSLSPGWTFLLYHVGHSVSYLNKEAKLLCIVLCN